MLSNDGAGGGCVAAALRLRDGAVALAQGAAGAELRRAGAGRRARAVRRGRRRDAAAARPSATARWWRRPSWASRARRRRCWAAAGWSSGPARSPTCPAPRSSASDGRPFPPGDHVRSQSRPWQYVLGHPKTTVTSMLPFALQAVSECPAHADLALALGAEFEPLDVDAALAEIDALAADLVEFRRACPGDQLRGVAAVVAQRFRRARRAAENRPRQRPRRPAAAPRARARRRPRAAADDRRGRGRPPRRDPARNRRQRGASSTSPTPPTPSRASPTWRSRVSWSTSAAASRELGWQCAHQVSALLLNRIAERSERIGHFAWALQAAELRLALPRRRRDAGADGARSAACGPASTSPRPAPRREAL